MSWHREALEVLEAEARLSLTAAAYGFDRAAALQQARMLARHTTLSSLEAIEQVSTILGEQWSAQQQRPGPLPGTPAAAVAELRAQLLGLRDELLRAIPLPVVLLVSRVQLAAFRWARRG